MLAPVYQKHGSIPEDRSWNIEEFYKTFNWRNPRFFGTWRRAHITYLSEHMTKISENRNHK